MAWHDISMFSAQTDSVLTLQEQGYLATRFKEYLQLIEPDVLSVAECNTETATSFITKYDAFLTEVWKGMQRKFSPETVHLSMPPDYDENMRKVRYRSTRTVPFLS